MPTKKTALRKTTHKPDDPEQSRRFIEMGKTLAADKDEKALAHGLKRLAAVKRKP